MLKILAKQELSRDQLYHYEAFSFITHKITTFLFWIVTNILNMNHDTNLDL